MLKWLCFGSKCIEVAVDAWNVTSSNHSGSIFAGNLENIIISLPAKIIWKHNNSTSKFMIYLENIMVK